METLNALSKKVRLDFVYGKCSISYNELNDWQQKAHQYRVTLKYNRRQMTIDWFQSEMNTSEPSAECVLDCLLSDYSSSEMRFEDFCAEFGYDSDSIKAYKTFKVCGANSRKLSNLLGSDLDNFLHSDRN